MSTRIVTLHGDLHNVVGEPLKVGQKAPNFTLLDTSLQTKTLADYGQSIKLLSVVPSLDTGVCDQQTRKFNEEVSKLSGATVITVSVDLPFAQKRWCGNAGLDKAITLSDHRDVAFGKAYGVLIDDLRLLSRAVFVLDAKNNITYVQYLAEVTDHPDYTKALEAVKKLL